MKKILSFLFACLIATAPLPALAAPEGTMNAGFISGIWYSTNSFFIGDKIRIYSAMQNNSGYDIIGTITFYDSQNIIGSSDFSVINGALIQRWADWTVTPGTHNIYARISNARKSEIGKNPEPITLASEASTPDTKTATIDPEHLAPEIPSPTEQTSTSSAATTTEIQSENTAEESDPGAIQKVIDIVQKITDQLLGRTSPEENGSPTISHTDTPAHTSSSVAPENTTTSIPNTETAETASSASTTSSSSSIGSFFAEKISKKKKRLDEKLAAEAEPKPIGALAKPLTALQAKIPFIAFPPEYVPSSGRLFSWFLGILIAICQTWWLLLIVFLLILRWIWKIFWFFWRRDRD